MYCIVACHVDYLEHILDEYAGTSCVSESYLYAVNAVRHIHVKVGLSCELHSIAEFVPACCCNVLNIISRKSVTFCLAVLVVGTYSCKSVLSISAKVKFPVFGSC